MANLVWIYCQYIYQIQVYQVEFNLLDQIIGGTDFLLCKLTMVVKYAKSVLGVYKLHKYIFMLSFLSYLKNRAFKISSFESKNKKRQKLK